jgi:hypothetical protein
VHPFGYGWVADSFQTLLNLQGVTMIQEKDSYIGLRSDIPGFFAHLKQQGGK